MNQSATGEQQALIRLLDDTDPAIFQLIREKIISIGSPIIPLLEEEWTQTFNPLVQHRIERIVHIIQFNSVKELFINWRDSLMHDLLDGLILAARINYPDLDQNRVKDQMAEIYEAARIETSPARTPHEKILALNRAIFERNGFRGNTANFHSPQNSFINTVLETRKGNPLLLGSIYSLAAQHCDIPVFGVNLPEHFILAYQEHNPVQLYGYAYPDADILFYINPFSQGAVFGKEAVDDFLAKLKIQPQASYFIPCSNFDILIRCLRNISLSFQKSGDYEKQNEVNQLIQIMNSSSTAAD